MPWDGRLYNAVRDALKGGVAADYTIDGPVYRWP
jgi:hypothetical protein